LPDSRSIIPGIQILALRNNLIEPAVSLELCEDGLPEPFGGCGGDDCAVATVGSPSRRICTR
jgi:hypothetical protein